LQAFKSRFQLRLARERRRKLTSVDKANVLDTSRLWRAVASRVMAEEFPDVVGYVSPLELGPPVGWPLQYRVSGPDKDEVRRIALDLANVVGAEPRTRHVNFDWMQPARELRVRIDQDQARRLGLSSAAVAAVLNANITGVGLELLNQGPDQYAAFLTADRANYAVKMKRLNIQLD
jgi:multidrug efflux pump subunit AcrB